MLELSRLSLDQVPWQELDAYPDRSVFQLRDWLEFLSASQGGDPVVARLRQGQATVGWFTGMVFSRVGIRILGSPFQGWTTGPMGFNLDPGVEKAAALQALFRFAFSDLRCLHVELLDRRLGFGDLAGTGARAATYETYELDLGPDEDTIFGAMSSSCRRAVRKSQKCEVAVEIAEPSGFADEYHRQLIDVFAKQELSPPYRAERVRQLTATVGPEHLLLLRARNPEGDSIATGIFPHFGDSGFFWGGASWREHQILRPNEALFWTAMKELKSRGVTTLDMGGGGDYKRKYGVTHVERPAIRRSRIRGVERLRDAAAAVAWRWATRRSKSPA